MNHQQSTKIIGCILGTAVGDALGLPYEGLPPSKIKSVTGHKLLLGKGMVSDDTEHTCMIAQALIVSGGDKKLFLRAFSWRLRWWLLCLPAGVGFATLRAILKLWLGFAPLYSGVYSAGNGSAMRSALLGVCYGEDLTTLTTLVKLSTIITHTDPKAEYGALAVAIAAYLSSQDTLILPAYYLKTLESILPPKAGEFLNLIKLACESADRGEDSQIFAASLGLSKGVTGYVYHTVPVVIQTWLRHQQDYPSAIKEIIKLGGDTDTTAAILGAIIGARVGKEGIPSLWLQNLWEYPRTVEWMEKLGEKLAQVCTTGNKEKPLPLAILPLIIRNVFFLLVIIGHVFYRLLTGKL
jgi:ADP-ribosylglycohydrolase